MGKDKFAWSLKDIHIEEPEPVFDPRAPRYKRLLIKTMFGGDEALYNEFLELFDAEVAAGSVIPYDAAMVEFRKKYLELPNGQWSKR
jgi:hypothetical protein